MMLRRLLASAVLLAMIAPSAHAQFVDTQECGGQMYDALAHEQRLYRSVLFGMKKAKDAPIGDVRFDKDGNSWLKKNGNEWRSNAEEFADETWNDSTMDDSGDAPERRGIFEIRSALTSELIPPLTQSLRALQCRLRAVCKLAVKSQSAKSEEKITVQPDGCNEFELAPYSACKEGVQATVGAQSCDEAVDGIMMREIELLNVVVAYDAAYRTLLQFSGSFEGFLTAFRFPLIQPLWQLTRAVGTFANMPCFLAQCDE